MIYNMSNTVKQLGFIPTNRGEFDTTGQTRYYKDNVVQYRNGSYICSPVGYSTSNPTAYTTDAPYQDGDTELNANWRLMASVGLVDNEPTAGSENLVKSGGVNNVFQNVLKNVLQKVDELNYLSQENSYLTPEGTTVSSEYCLTKTFDVENLSFVAVTGRQGGDLSMYALAGVYNSNNELLKIFQGNLSTNYSNYIIDLPSDTKYLKVCSSYTVPQPYVKCISLSVKGEYNYESVYNFSKAISIEANSDLNDYTTPGTYKVFASDAQTVQNIPFIGGGFLTVSLLTPSENTAVKQTFVFGLIHKFERYKGWSGNAYVWTDWRETTAGYWEDISTDLFENAVGVLVPIEHVSGYLTPSGTIVNNSGTLTKTFQLNNYNKLYITGRQGNPTTTYALAAFYNSSKEFISAVLGTAGTSYSDYEVSVPNGAKYIKICSSNISLEPFVECKTNVDTVDTNVLEKTPSSALQANTNLNNIITPGFYSVLTTVSSTLVNAPRTSGGGYLSVELTTPTNTGSIKQTFIYGLAYQYSRFRFSTDGVNFSWTDWRDDNASYKDFNGLNIIVPEYWKSELQTSINSVLSNRLLIGENIVELIFITDTHYLQNIKNSPVLTAYLQKALNIDNIVFGGDAIDNSGNTKLKGLQELQSFVSDFNYRNLFFTIGNHDTNMYAGATLSDSELYGTVIKPTERFGVTDKSVEISYYDNEIQKVRFIQYSYKLSDSQKVLDLIQDLSSEWTVVIFTHEFWEADPDGGTPTIIPEKQSFMNAIIDGEYSCTIAAFIVGHVHSDQNALLHNDIPVISTTTDCLAKNLYGGPTMTQGTNTEQAFDIIQLDTYNRKLYFTRVGAGNDRGFPY